MMNSIVSGEVLSVRASWDYTEPFLEEQSTTPVERNLKEEPNPEDKIKIF